MDDGSVQKKAKGTKKCVMKRRIMFVYLIKKPYLKNNKDLNVIIMICTQRELIRLL